MAVITSRQHPIVKHLRELARAGAPQILLDGWHLIAEAARAGIRLHTVALCGTPGPEHQDILRRATGPDTRIFEVSSGVMNAVSPVKSPTGIVASAARPDAAAAALRRSTPQLLLAGAGVQDPGNVGALVRSAAAAGGTGVILDHASADPWGWKALRASMGTTFRIPVDREASLEAAIDGWRASGITVLAAVPRGGTSMYDVDLARPVAILLGGEGPGLSDALIGAADIPITIHLEAEVESLNVAVAAALLLFEARRQRMQRAHR